MKKSLVVLLIAVLVAGYAFADPTYSGEVTAKAAYNLDEHTFAYSTADTLEATFTFAKTLDRNVIGTAYPYINVAGSVALTASLEGQSIKQELDIDTFEVVGEGWKLNLIAKSGQFDYAVSAIDSAKVETKQYAAKVASPYTLSWGAKDNAGIAYTNDNFGTIFVTGAMVGDKAAGEDVVKLTQSWNYDTKKWEYDSEGYVLIYETYVKSAKEYVATSETDTPYDYTEKGAGFEKVYGQKYGWFVNNEEIPGYTSAQVEAQTKVLAITDALSAQFAAGFNFKFEDNPEDSFFNYGASAKFAYNDVAAIAADFGWDETSDGAPWFFDVAGSLKVGVFTFDGYYATETAVADKTYDKKAGITTPTDNYFSLKAVAEIEEIGTTFTATAQDIFVFSDSKYSVEAVNTYIPGYTFTVGISNDFNEMFWASAEAEYENGLSLGLGATFGFMSYIPATVETSIGYTSDEFEVSFEGAFSFEDGPEATLLSTFHADKFDVIGNAYYNTKLDANAGVSCAYNTTVDGLFVEAGIETDKLVDGAKFNLTYKSGALYGGTFELGSVEAGLTVKF